MTLQRLTIEEDRISAQLRGMTLEGIVAQPIGNPCIVRSNNYHVYGNNPQCTEDKVPMPALFKEIEKIANERYPSANAFVASLDDSTRIGDSYFYSNFAVQFYRTEGDSQ